MATLYLVKGYLAEAATSLADAQALLTALANPGTAANSAIIDRITSKVEDLVQSDSGEPLVISSIDDAAGTISAWVTDASTTVAVGLGDADSNSLSTYASTLSLSITGSTRTGSLALNTTALSNALAARSFPGRSFPGRYGSGTYAVLTLHIRRTTAGLSETVALLSVSVFSGVLGAPTIPVAADEYLSLTSAYAGYVRNLSGVTSITGGGSTTLDGQAAGSAAFPVGCIVVTSDSDVGRHWKLKGTYIAATDLDLGKVKPTNSDSILNACHWQTI